MSRRRILLVDDDRDLVTALAEQFLLLGEFEACTASTGHEGLEAVRGSRYDVLVLDVGLPDMDGRELCRLIRRHGFDGVIIMLTGMSSESDTIFGLEAGADDYVAKPIRFAELLARVRAHLRQLARSEDAVVTIGTVTFDPARRLLTGHGGRAAELSDMEAAVLKYLCGASGVIDRTRLLSEVWGYAEGADTHTVESHIHRLRKKLSEVMPGREILVTEKGGYRLAR